MTKVIFYLKAAKANSKGELPLIAQVALNYEKYRKQVGMVKESDWNQKGQRLKIPKIGFQRNEEENERKVTFNKFLAKIVEKVENISNNAVLENRKLTLDEVREIFLIDESSAKTKPFLELFLDFIDSNKPDKAVNTIKGYVTVLNFLKDFEVGTNYSLTWESINYTFLDKLKHYTIITRKKQNGYFVKIVRVTTTFLHWAKKRNHYDGEIIDEIDIKEPEKEVVFLSIEELLTLYNYNFKSERLESARDLYCFSAFTGLRFSDLFNLKHEHITPNYIINKMQKKTSDRKSLPLNAFAIDILKRNEGLGSPLPIKASQNINVDIKECLKVISENPESKIDYKRLIICKKHFGKKEIDEIKPLYEAITFHTARKTFITNSVMMGIPIPVLQEYGAPKKSKDLKKYLKITDAFMQQTMDNSWNKLNYPPSSEDVVCIVQ